MNEGRKRRQAKQARRDARRASTVQHETPEETPLVDEVRQALASRQPIDLLGMVSTLIEATKPDPLAFLPSREKRDAVDLDALIASFIGVPIRETTAVLAVLAVLLDDADLQLRCRREVERRQDPLPQWISDLMRVDVYRAVRMTHVLGDGDEILIGARLAGGGELTCCAFVDHTMMSEVNDAFIVSNDIDSVVSIAREQNTDPDTSFVDMSLADARAWIEHGIARNFYPAGTDSWPASRPLVQWLNRQIPKGGTKHQVPEWDSELLDEFFASEYGASFAALDFDDVLERILDTGDPFRWSVPHVERALDKEYELPVKVAVRVPDLLRAYIRFAHAKSGIRDELTAEALEAIDAVTAK